MGCDEFILLLEEEMDRMDGSFYSLYNDLRHLIDYFFVSAHGEREKDNKRIFGSSWVAFSLILDRRIYLFVIGIFGGMRAKFVFRSFGRSLRKIAHKPNREENERSRTTPENLGFRRQ